MTETSFAQSSSSSEILPVPTSKIIQLGNEDDVIEKMKCGLCGEIPAPTFVYCCRGGHIMCKICVQTLPWPSMPECPVEVKLDDVDGSTMLCKQRISRHFSQLYDTLYNTAYHRCLFHDFGCTKPLLGSEVAKHCRICDYRPHATPTVDDLISLAEDTEDEAAAAEEQEEVKLDLESFLNTSALDDMKQEGCPSQAENEVPEILVVLIDLEASPESGQKQNMGYNAYLKEQEDLSYPDELSQMTNIEIVSTLLDKVPSTESGQEQNVANNTPNRKQQEGSSRSDELSLMTNVEILAQFIDQPNMQSGQEQKDLTNVGDTN